MKNVFFVQVITRQFTIRCPPTRLSRNDRKYFFTYNDRIEFLKKKKLRGFDKYSETFKIKKFSPGKGNKGKSKFISVKIGAKK